MVDAEMYVSPCPFSKGYHIPATQAWQLLDVFWMYRFTLAFLFAVLFFSGFGPSLLGQHDPMLYLVSSSAYLGLVIISGLLIYFRWPAYRLQVVGVVMIDLTALTVLMHASGGIKSGIGMLLAVSVAVGGLLSGRRCALFFAALATIVILCEQVYSDVNDSFDTTAYTYAGMLGVAFFSIALLAHVLAQRVEHNEAIALQRAGELSRLQKINDYIIQHLQSGMIILDRGMRVLMMNLSARRLFDLPATPENLGLVSADLLHCYRNWLADRVDEPMLLRTQNDATVQIRFTEFNETDQRLHMIFLEDSALINQRIQQSKLASLGRLTASIAHEIRNPLGAISHAGQLLAESADLSDQDVRLTNIICDHTKRLNRVIENVLQISRRNASQRENIALKPWLERFAKGFQTQKLLTESPFQLDVESDDMAVLADPSHLNQILDNLCNNALKHGVRNGARIQLTAKRYRGAPSIEVIDNGPGISAVDAQHMFEPFFTTSTSGTGLGLYIAKELAELNQSKLDYEILPELGSCFRICLPDANALSIAI